MESEMTNSTEPVIDSSASPHHDSAVVVFAYIAFSLGGVLMLVGFVYVLIWAFCNRNYARSVGRWRKPAKFQDEILAGRKNATEKDEDGDSLHLDDDQFLPREGSPVFTEYSNRRSIDEETVDIEKVKRNSTSNGVLKGASIENEKKRDSKGSQGSKGSGKAKRFSKRSSIEGHPNNIGVIQENNNEVQHLNENVDRSSNNDHDSLASQRLSEYEGWAGNTHNDKTSEVSEDISNDGPYRVREPEHVVSEDTVLEEDETSGDRGSGNWPSSVSQIAPPSAAVMISRTSSDGRASPSNSFSSKQTDSLVGSTVSNGDIHSKAGKKRLFVKKSESDKLKRHNTPLSNGFRKESHQNDAYQEEIEAPSDSVEAINRENTARSRSGLDAGRESFLAGNRSPTEQNTDTFRHRMKNRNVSKTSSVAGESSVEDGGSSEAGTSNDWNQWTQSDNDGVSDYEEVITISEDNLERRRSQESQMMESIHKEETNTDSGYITPVPTKRQPKQERESILDDYDESELQEESAPPPSDGPPPAPPPPAINAPKEPEVLIIPKTTAPYQQEEPKVLSLGEVIMSSMSMGVLNKGKKKNQKVNFDTGSNGSRDSGAGESPKDSPEPSTSSQPPPQDEVPGSIPAAPPPPPPPPPIPPTAIPGPSNLNSNGTDPQDDNSDDDKDDNEPEEVSDHEEQTDNVTENPDTDSPTHSTPTKSVSFSTVDEDIDDGSVAPSTYSRDVIPDFGTQTTEGNGLYMY